MNQDLETLRSCIAQFSPAACNYEEWLAVGMALKDCGGSCSEWEAWSRADSRYKQNECGRKWKSFNGGGAAKVGVGSIVELCRRNGGKPPKGAFKDEEIGWEDYIGRDGASPAKEDYKIVNDWTIDQPIEASPLSPIQQLMTYLRTLFQSEEIVGYNTEAWLSEPDQEGKQAWMPKKGVYSDTAGELIQRLSTALDIGSVVGDAEDASGAWIRFNPLDGKGVADTNVTAYRFALVESDTLPIERQNAILRELQLPIAALVHSAGKSLHAIVRIDAPNYDEYQKRVTFLYEVCKKNGMEVDRKNRNPSRLSRMPGAVRNGRVQQLVATGLGLQTWDDWTNWIAAQNDELPDIENFGAAFYNLPPLADSIIEGILRQGHKMRLTGPSKGGKSFSVQELAVAVAEGASWLGWPCAKGRVLYINTELDARSMMHRLHDIYVALGIKPTGAASIDVWNLRGRTPPIHALAPSLIRRALKKRAEGKPYTMIIIDPIYKLYSGDENSAAEVTKFCNQLDKIATELEVAVVDVHHHSKGEQGQKKAGDRGSGSGVFLRDPDATIDLVELTLDEAKRKTIGGRWACERLEALLDASPTLAPDWRDDCPQDDAVVAAKLLAYAVTKLGPERPAAVWAAAEKTQRRFSAYRVEAVLREFEPIDPVRIFFRHPLHIIDKAGILLETTAAGEIDPKELARRKAREWKEKIDSLVSMVSFKSLDGGKATVEEVAADLGVTTKTVENWIPKAVKSGVKLRLKAGVITMPVATEKDEEL